MYQKAKIHFLKKVDQNSKFFYDMVKMNVARNSILAVAKEDGSIITGAKDIAREFVAYYTLLCSEVHTLPVDVVCFNRAPNSLLSIPWTLVKQPHR